MIITLEHEDIEAALLSWMNEKGMVANSSTTSIVMSKARNTGRITAVIDPNGRASGSEVVTAGEASASVEESTPASESNLFAD